MTSYIETEKRARVARGLSNGIFFFGLAIIHYFNRWWPDIMLLFAIQFFIRFGFQKKIVTCITSVVVTLGIYFLVRLGEIFPHLQVSPAVIVFVGIGIITLIRGFSGKDNSTIRSIVVEKRGEENQ